MKGWIERLQLWSLPVSVVGSIIATAILSNISLGWIAEDGVLRRVLVVTTLILDALALATISAFAWRVIALRVRRPDPKWAELAARMRITSKPWMDLVYNTNREGLHHIFKDAVARAKAPAGWKAYLAIWRGRDAHQRFQLLCAPKDRVSKADLDATCVAFAEMTNELLRLEDQLGEFADEDPAAFTQDINTRHRIFRERMTQWLHEVDQLSREVHDATGKGLDLLTRSVAMVEAEPKTT